MAKAKGLGKGLDALMGDTSLQVQESSGAVVVPISQVEPGLNQPRKRFDEDALADLAASIEEHGIIQPLTVRRREGRWELVAGERRLRAARLAGLEEVPCLSIQTDGQASSLLALVENLQRRDLDFWEEAAALRKLIDTYHISQEEAARRIGKSPSAVANKLRLLKLSPDVLSLLRDGGATERHARALLRLDAPEQQLEGARQVVNQGLTVAQTEALVDGMLSSKAHPARRRPVFVIKDVRLFLNTITRSLDVMRSAGVDAQCSRQDSEDAITLTIHIPRRAG